MVARSVLGDDAVEVDKLDEEGTPTAGPLTTFGYDLDVSVGRPLGPVIDELHKANTLRIDSDEGRDALQKDLAETLRNPGVPTGEPAPAIAPAAPHCNLGST